MGSRYLILRVIAIVLKISAVLSFGGAIYAAVELNEGIPFPYTTLPASAALLIGFVSALLVWARSETIMVSIDTEENTRRTATLLQMIVDRQSGAPVGEDYRRSLNGVWEEPPAAPPRVRQGPPPPRRWIDEQRTK